MRKDYRLPTTDYRHSGLPAKQVLAPVWVARIKFRDCFALLAMTLLATCYLLLATPAKAVDLATQYGFGGIKSLGQGLGYLVAPAFSIAGTGVVIYFLIGSFKLLTSGGDKNNIQAGKDMIVHAIIGFVLLIAMFLILQYIPELFGIDLRIIKTV